MKRDTTRDVQQLKVYRAENEARKLHPQEQFESHVAVQRWIDTKLLKYQWFKRAFPYARHIRVDRKGRTRAHGLHVWNGGIIYLPDGWGLGRWIVIHEIAHAITPYKPIGGGAFGSGFERDLGGHGREFCIIYLKLVKHVFGSEVERTLKAQFKLHHVKYRRKKVLSAEQLARMRERGLKLAALKKPKDEQT